MRNKCGVLTIVGLAVLLGLLLAAGVASAAQPSATAVSGTWYWENTMWESMVLPKGGEVGHGEENGWWTGGLSGTSFDTFKAVFQPFGEGGFGIGTLWVNFDGAVNEVDGKLLMRLNFWAHGDGFMHGHWTIVKGADGLEGVSGGGTWIIGPEDILADYNGVVRMK